MGKLVDVARRLSAGGQGVECFRSAILMSNKKCLIYHILIGCIGASARLVKSALCVFLLVYSVAVGVPKLVLEAEELDSD